MNESLIGKTIDGRYKLLERIGEGGMGVVYKARQAQVDRLVAIKMLSPQLSRDPSWIQRFLNEAKACSRLHHPNTIRMFDFGQSREGHFFIAMELLEGCSLRQLIAKAAPMAPLRVLRILAQCCASLAEAHNMGIIHRDIKSDNVFVLDLAGQADYIKLLDFSVAKLIEGADGARTQAGVIFGTPEYMSPEQGRGEPLGTRSDLYALGILAYEMLCGRVPFTSPTPIETLAMHMRSPVPPLPAGTPPEVVDFVMRALEKDQKLRWPSAAVMLDRCNELLARLTSGAFALPSGPPPLGGQARPMTGPPRAHAATANDKTIVASPLVEPRYPVAPGAAQPPYPSTTGPLRTVMLPDSSGVVSFANPTARPQEPPPPGASPLFWIICLVTGLLVGIGAYWMVLELRR